jgi:hypothetical protein
VTRQGPFATAVEKATDNANSHRPPNHQNENTGLLKARPLLGTELHRRKTTTHGQKLPENFRTKATRMAVLQSTRTQRPHAKRPRRTTTEPRSDYVPRRQIHLRAQPKTRTRRHQQTSGSQFLRLLHLLPRFEAGH